MDLDDNEMSDYTDYLPDYVMNNVLILYNRATLMSTQKEKIHITIHNAIHTYNNM